MKKFEQGPAMFETEMLRSAGELILARTVLEKHNNTLYKKELASKSLKELIALFPAENPRTIELYFTYKKASGREAALNYSLGRRTMNIDPKDYYKVLLENKDLRNPKVRPVQEIIDARDINEKVVRETLGELHLFINNYDLMNEQERGGVRFMGNILKTKGKIEGIQYALYQNNEIAEEVADAKKNNKFPIKLFPTP